MRRWKCFYNSTCNNCSKLGLALVSMVLLNSISLYKGIQQGSPSVCIWALHVTEEKNPTWLKYNFFTIPAPLLVYLSEKKWIVLVLKMVLSSPHHLWTPRALSKHWYNQTAVRQQYTCLVFSKVLSPFSKSAPLLVHQKEKALLARVLLRSSWPKHFSEQQTVPPPSHFCCAQLTDRSIGPCCSHEVPLQQQGQGIVRKEGVPSAILPVASPHLLAWSGW